MEKLNRCAKTTKRGGATCSIDQKIAEMVRYDWMGERNEIDVD